MSIRTIPNQLKALMTQNMAEAGLTGPDEAVRSRRHIVLYGYSNSLIFNLTSGAFLSGFWLALNADADWISMVIMLASLANILQITSPFILQMINNPKRFLTIIRLLQHTFNLLAAAIIPLLGLPGRVTLYVVLIFVLIGFVLGAIAGPGLQMWHLKSIPPGRRLGFFSFLHATNVIITFSAMFFGGLFTDWLSDIANARLAFSLLRFILVLIAAVDIYVLTKIDNPGVPGAIARKRGKGLLALPKHIAEHPIYLFTILTAALWAMASSIPGQYYIVYLISSLNYSYSMLTGVSLLNLVVILLLTPFWKRIIARLAWMRSFSVSMIFYAAALIALAFVSHGTFGFVLYILASFYSYIMMVGISLSFSNLTYVNMPEENQTSFIALFNATFHAAILLGIWLGNRFMALTSAYETKPFILGLTSPQLLMLVTALLIILSGFGVWQIGKVEKPQPADE